MIVVAGGVALIALAPRTYRSEARLFLQVGRESVRLDPTATTGDTIALHQTGRDSEIATAMEVLKSRAIIEKTVDRLTPAAVLAAASGESAAGPQWVESLKQPVRRIAQAIRSLDPISQRERAVIEIEKNLEVYAEFDSALIVISLDARSPQLAQQVLATIVDVYREQHVRLYQTEGSKPFFEQQRAEFASRLAAAEDRLREAKNRMSVASIESRRETLETQLRSIEEARHSTLQRIAAAEARIASLQQRIGELPERLLSETRVVPNTGADVLRSQLYALQVELMNLEAKYSDDHPLVKATRAQVEEAKEMARHEAPSRQETVDGLNGNRLSLSLSLAQAESDLAGDVAQRSTLEEQRSAALASLKQLNDFEAELEQLNRDVELARTSYFNYATAFEQSRMDEELNRRRISNVNVAQAATLAEKPVGPSKLLIAGMTLALLTVGTVALVLLAEALDGRIRSEEQLEQLLQLPVLAAVPEARAYRTAPVAAAPV
ncbi:MAG: hypothetical protein DCC67_03930 [Planctomycetota bacterium]|nr:MAG: hypothetical protein DCC67_03930 [Planctomycetota bacterium]